MDENWVSKRSRDLPKVILLQNSKARTWNQNFYLQLSCFFYLSRYWVQKIKKAIVGQSVMSAVLFHGPLSFRKYPPSPGNIHWCGRVIPVWPFFVLQFSHCRLMGRRRYDGVGRVGSIVVYFRRSQISTSYTKVQILNLQPSIFMALAYLNALFFIVVNCESDHSTYLWECVI